MEKRNQLTVTMTADVSAALDAACSALGGIVPRARVAAFALLRGARAIAADPVSLLADAAAAAAPPASTAAPSPPPVEAARDAEEPAPSPPPVQAPAPTAEPVPNARRDGRWGTVAEDDYVALARDLDALVARGMSATAIAGGAEVHVGNFHAWRKRRRAGDPATMSASTFTSLRRFVDKALKRASAVDKAAKGAR